MIEFFSSRKSIIIYSCLVFLLFISVIALIISQGSTSSSDISPAPMPAPSQSDSESHVILIDPGHGGFDAGASGIESGVREDELNLAVSFLVRDELIKNGYSVILTRENENALAHTKSDDMKMREKIIKESKVDIVISIHMNKFSDRSIFGPMVFYNEEFPSSKHLADCIISALCDQTGNPHRLPNPEDLFITRISPVPSVIVECGFLSNKNDELRLSSPEYQQLVASGIVCGVIDFFKNTYNCVDI